MHRHIPDPPPSILTRLLIDKILRLPNPFAPGFLLLNHFPDITSASFLTPGSFYSLALPFRTSAQHKLAALLQQAPKTPSASLTDRNTHSL